MQAAVGHCFAFFEKECSRIDARTKMIDISIDDAYTLDDLRLDINELFITGLLILKSDFED